MYPPTRAQREENERRNREQKPISAAFWASGERRSAADIDAILAQRRHAEIWEKNFHGEASSLDVYEAYMTAYVPPDCRVARLRKDEELARKLNDTDFLRTIAAYRLLQQQREP
jgi:hypothetical protein